MIIKAKTKRICSILLILAMLVGLLPTVALADERDAVLRFADDAPGEFFPPDADMQTAEPEFVVPFVISTPEINIEFSGGLTVDDLVGTYSGTVTATAVRVTEEMYQLYINEQLADEY